MWNYKLKKTLFIAALGLAFIMLLIGLAGCMTPEKATSFLKKKDLLDDTCAANFPVQEKFIKGDTIETTDTLWGIDYQTDTIRANDTVYIKRVEPGKTITRTIRVVDTVVKRDIAYENVLQDKNRDLTTVNNKQTQKIETLTESVEEWKAKAKKRMLWVLILIGAVGMYTLLKVRKLIPF